MNIANDQMARLEAAIAGQERLRSTLGDPVVDDAIAALRQQLAELKARAGAPAGRGEDIGSSGELASRALASLQSHLPAELAAKARATPWVEGERRQVTLVFADLSGFTSLSENADPEVIRTFQHDLFSELARIIYQYEGFVEKFVGDAVLAVFGAPVCHEDDAERALRAALAMRERMAVLNRRWSERLGTPVTLHVGVNTGSVVAGKIGSEIDGGSANYAVTGDTVNTAARLQDAAQPGQILVSRTTYRLAHGAFTFQALEPITVRNRREPLPVYELLRARLLPGKLRGIQELGEAFVGRERALEQLQAVTTGLAEHGGIVLITGDAGIGKSRLVAEWRKRTQESVRWLEGRCFAHTSALSYGPFLDMLRRLAGIVDDDSDRRARQRLEGALERLFPGDARARAIIVHLLAMRPRREEAALLRKLTPRQVRESIQVMADQLVRRMTQDRPLVIFLDDMQWADASTVELVGHLLDTTAAERLAVVIAGRPDPGTPVAQLESVLEGDQYRQRTERVSLDRLSDALSLAMMSALLSAPNLPPELGALISDKAEGNPFFVEEIIRSLIELGALKREGETWQRAPKARYKC